LGQHSPDLPTPSAGGADAGAVVQANYGAALNNVLRIDEVGPVNSDEQVGGVALLKDFERSGREHFLSVGKVNQGVVFLTFKVQNLIGWNRGAGLLHRAGLAYGRGLNTGQNCLLPVARPYVILRIFWSDSEINSWRQPHLYVKLRSLVRVLAPTNPPKALHPTRSSNLTV
jgi:hypothetical protein